MACDINMITLATFFFGGLLLSCLVVFDAVFFIFLGLGLIFSVFYY